MQLINPSAWKEPPSPLQKYIFCHDPSLKSKNILQPFWKKAKANDVRSKWIKQLLVTSPKPPRFIWVPSSLVSVRAKNRINCPCESQSLQYSTKALQPPVRTAVSGISPRITAPKYSNTYSKAIRGSGSHRTSKATVCLLSASTAASSVPPTCPPTSPSPASVQPEAIPNLHKSPCAPVIFQLHEAHIIIKLHDNLICLLNFAFPRVAVCHVAPLPQEAHWWAPRPCPITQQHVPPPGSAEAGGFVLCFFLHPISSAPLSSPSPTSVSLSSWLSHHLLHPAWRITRYPSSRWSDSRLREVHLLLHRQRESTAATTAVQSWGPRERSPEAQVVTGHPTTTASSEETPHNLLVMTARCPGLWLHSPGWKENLFAPSLCCSSPLKAVSWELESQSCYQPRIFICE